MVGWDHCSLEKVGQGDFGLGIGGGVKTTHLQRLLPRALTPQSWGTKTQSEAVEWVLYKTVPSFENGEYYFCTKQKNSWIKGKLGRWEMEGPSVPSSTWASNAVAQGLDCHLGHGCRVCCSQFPKDTCKDSGDSPIKIPLQAETQKHHPVADHSASLSDPALCSAKRERRVISLS